MYPFASIGAQIEVSRHCCIICNFDHSIEHDKGYIYPVTPSMQVMCQISWIYDHTVPEQDCQHPFFTMPI